MVEKQSILKHLDELRMFLKDLQKYGDTITKEHLGADRDKQNMVLYPFKELFRPVSTSETISSPN